VRSSPRILSYRRRFRCASLLEVELRGPALLDEEIVGTQQAYTVTGPPVEETHCRRIDGGYAIRLELRCVDYIEYRSAVKVLSASH
jgi:hypothetical protein